MCIFCNCEDKILDLKGRIETIERNLTLKAKKELLKKEAKRYRENSSIPRYMEAGGSLMGISFTGEQFKVMTSYFNGVVEEAFEAGAKYWEKPCFIDYR